MFKKNDYKLKEDFRKLLFSTDGLYSMKKEIEPEEEKAVICMWRKIIGDNGSIAVERLQKQGYRLGIMISTVKSNIGYLHEIINIEEKSVVSKSPLIRVRDIIVEANGVNLLLLTYSQLVLTLGALPNNIQFVIWKKEESVYEKTDIFEVSSFDSHYYPTKENEDSWMPPVMMIVKCSRTKYHGLEFINNMPEIRNISKCVLQKICKEGYFFEDKRISINDSIVQLNDLDLQKYSDKESLRAFTNNKKSVLLIRVRKYHSWGPNDDDMNTSGSKLSLPLSCKEGIQSRRFIHSTPSLLSRKTLSKSSVTTLERRDSVKVNIDSEIQSSQVEYEEKLIINLDPSDDLKVYLVDIKEGGKQKSIICGFHPESSLRKKFKFKDEIFKINEEEVDNKTSKEIGYILKNFDYRKIPIFISVIRKCKKDEIKYKDDLIVSPDILTTDSCLNDDEQILNVTIFKTDDSFGLRVKIINSPTITEIIPDSAAEKSGLVKVDDKIITINDIYVKDKDDNFVITMIRSCGEKMNLKICRKSCQNSNIQLTENQTYFSDRNNSMNEEEDVKEKRHSKYLPLPPLLSAQKYEVSKDQSVSRN